MSKRLNELPNEIGQRIANELMAQQREILKDIEDVDKRLTNTNFLTNGGGAIATLAFLGTGIDIPSAQCA